MEIRDIKQKLSIQTVLNHYNLYPDRNGMLKCPFHKDDTASMKVYPETNTYNCFGCHRNGDAIEFCTEKEGSKHEGLIKAAELCGLHSENPKTKKFQVEKLPAENYKETLSKAFESFRNGLHSPISKRAKEYINVRGLDISKLEMGYNSGQYHHRGKLSQDELNDWIATGLLVPYNGSVPNSSGTTYTAFAKDCIIFPLKDKKNQIVSLYGRGIQENKNGSGKHYYLKNRTGLYPGYPNPNITRLILTEAVIDTASLLQIPEIAAEYSVLACYGTNGLTEEHKAAIKEWATCPELVEGQEIIFFFDGDKAGTDAIQKYHQELSEILPSIKLSAVETPENEDVNSLSVAYGTEIFIHLLENRLALSRVEGKALFLLTEESLPENPSIKKENLSDPEPPKATLNTRNPDYITYTTDELQIIILGGINLQQLDRLRITVKISRTDTGDPLHSIRHTLDLYHSDYLEKFINKACEQLETGTNVLKRAIAELTEQIEQYRLSKIESLKELKPKQRQLTEQGQRKAINYLKAPRLMERTNSDIGKTGMIGEENNRLLMYLVFTSRLREQPLHIISLGSSGTGKTYLQEKVSEMIPEQDKLEITILSENAFYYFDRKELKHKLVLIEDMDGAQDVLYPLRELQSKKRISKTIPIKDSKGNLRTITLQVEGPICLAGTTTRERLFEDNSNRSLLIYLDNSHEHKEQIMEYQRKLSAGKVNTKEENELKEFFKDMQSVLKPIHVRNPYAEMLKLPEYVFKPLRTNSHYLATIETITFYHQYQRELKTDETTGELYIETTLEDIEWANKLLRDVLLAKADELNQALRNFYETLKYHVKASGKGVFYSKEIREKLRMNPMTVNRYTRELENRNFIKRTGGNKKSGFEYEISNWEEYTQLQTNINALDEVLNNLKSKYNISITKPDVILKPSETPVN
jgi:DNA primase